MAAQIKIRKKLGSVYEIFNWGCKVKLTLMQLN